MIVLPKTRGLLATLCLTVLVSACGGNSEESEPKTGASSRPKASSTPKAGTSNTPKPGATSTPISSPEPGVTPDPTPGGMGSPTSAPIATQTPSPGNSATPTRTPKPVMSSTPTNTPNPNKTPKPGVTKTPAPGGNEPPTGDVEVVDEQTYDGNIPLGEQAAGKPGAALQTQANPFADAYFYVSPDITTMMNSSLDIVTKAGDKDMADKIKYVQRQPSAVWMDSIETIHGVPGSGRRSLEKHLDAAVAQQQYYEQRDGKKSPMTVVVIIYDLPDRDCAAFASNGKLVQVGNPKKFSTPADGDGFERYRDEYIREIASIFTKKPEYKDLRIVAMLEPDSFPNMITNTNESSSSEANGSLNPKQATVASGGYCDRILSDTSHGLSVMNEGTAENPNLGLYAASLRLAISEFAQIDNVYTYLDIGHAGWLGWDSTDDNVSNMKRGVRYFKQLIDGADGVLDGKGFDMVRGFASNTSGYTPVEEPLISNSIADRQKLSDWYEWNPAVDELSYIDMLKGYFTSTGPYIGSSKFDADKLGFIIDTARNGWGATDRPTPGSGAKGSDSSQRVDKRVHRGHWCHPRGAGVGEVPKANPDANRSHLDAFFWMKPPGESDGISFDHKKLSQSDIDALDAVDRAVYDSASDPVYDGKALDTMCIKGEQREGKPVDPEPYMAPHAGAWFHKQFLSLIENAYPPLGSSDYSTGGSTPGGNGGTGGGAGTGGGSGTGGNTNTGGNTGAGVLFSEDFESQTLKSAPADWGHFVAWQQNGPNPNQGVFALVDNTKAHSGKNAIHIKGDAKPAMITRALPQGTDTLYVRAWINMNRQLGANPGENHETLIALRGKAGDANDEVRFGEIKGVIGTNEVPTDDIAPKSSEWGKGPSFAPNTWHCVEVAFLAKPAYDELHASINGMSVHTIDGADDWNNRSLTKPGWLEGNFVELALGWHSFSSKLAAVDLWMDDIVVSTQPIGCD